MAYLAAAWVVIAAGIVFILATVFFAGAFVVGFGDHCHHHHHHGMMYKPDGPWGPGGGAWGPGGGAWGPGGGPYPPGGPPPGAGPGGPGGPSQLPTTSAPAPNAPGTPRP
jgi:hypothetical protein